ARSAAGRCSSTVSAPAAASSFRSAASSIPATDARRVSKRCTAARRSRRSCCGTADSRGARVRRDASMRLAGKVAIVTGGGSGFGEGIAKRFAEEGARVVVNDIDERGGARVTAEIEKAQGQGSAVFLKGDVAVNADVARLVRACLDRYGKLDIVVNNAGVTHINGPMLEVSEALFDRVFAVNAKSLYLSALHTVPVFRRQGAGCIINTASTAGIRPRPGLVWYNGSKGAAITIT